ncbi:MAG: hypothetical protein LBJ25_05785, partial [Candidatus Margulisbacteria bacterium]|nr:hypothetical protein [Candidatus Margulisiibacteriota bacterium]
KSALIFPVVLIDEGKPDLLTLQYHKRYISQNIGYLFNPSGEHDVSRPHIHHNISIQLSSINYEILVKKGVGGYAKIS